MIAKAWTDPAFKERLLAEPTAVAREQGLDIPEDLPLRAIEIAPGETYLVLTPSGAVAMEEQGPWLALPERAASDPSYKARLMAGPASVLAEQGIVLPADARVTVVEPSDTEGYLFVPPIPEGLDIETLDDDTAGYYTTDGTSSMCKCQLDAFSSLQLTSAQSRPISLIGPVLVTHRSVPGGQLWLA